MRSYYFDFGSDRTILLTGQIHGNEPISKLVLMGFAQGLIEGSTFETNNNHIYQYNYHIIPEVNTNYSRHNIDGIDLNRNFPNGKEALELKDLLRPHYYAVFDCHEILVHEIDEDDERGSYYYYSSYASESPPVLPFLRAKEPVIDSSKESSLGSFEQYMFDSWGTKHVFTLETYTGDSLNTRARHMQSMITQLIMWIGDK